MVHVGQEYRDAIADIEVKPGNGAEFFSSVTGLKATAHDLGPDYWVANMLSEVKFGESVRQLCLGTSSGKKSGKRGPGSGVNDIVELGPHSALAGPIKQTIQADEKLSAASIGYYSALARNKNAVDTILKLVSSLFTLGYSVNMPSINRPSKTPTKPSVLVDLPPYAWNHTNTYWAESRRSKAYRNRPSARSDLLGALERTSSPLEPRWSNYIRLSEIPWVRDHVIQSNIVYPAAGYIVMAIEAAHQRAMQRSVQRITGFNLREVVIGAALVIPENPGEVEIAVTLKSYPESMKSPSDIWDEFIVSSVSPDDRWTEHCRGLVSVQTASKAVNVIDGNSQRVAEQGQLTAMTDKYKKICQKEVRIPQFYETIAKLGLEYGATFACMTEALSGPSSCIGRIKIPDTAAVMPKEHQFPFVMHPATLDALFHTIFVALGVDDMKDPAVPVSMEEMFIASNITNHVGHELVSYTTTEKKDNRSMSASLTVLSENQTEVNEPVIRIRGISCITLENSDTHDVATEKQFRGYNFDWKPDVDMLSHGSMNSASMSTPAMSNINIRHKFEVAAFYLLRSVVDTLKSEGASFTTTYQQDLWNTVNEAVQTTIANNSGSLSNQWISASEIEQTVLLRKVKAHGPEGRTLCHIGEKLHDLLTGMSHIT